MTSGQKKTENILYLALWATLFAAPMLSMYITGISSHDYDWEGSVSAWKLLAVFFATFVVHNFLLAPLLVYQNKKWTYAAGVILLLVCFESYQIYTQPHRPIPKEQNDRTERTERHPDDLPPDLPMKPEPTDRIKDGKGPMRKPSPHRPPQAFGGQDSVAFIIITLLLGLNVGCKYFFKSLDDRKRIKELERENLHQQLEYLKYQINPHFFMNTLNNIHALVDINPEQAKYTIEVLSRLMRYVLYEGNKPMAPLQREVDFIRHYIDLMRIRYTDRVHISLSLPEQVPDVAVPPLVFTTFIENAFKHGVSYAQESFIEIQISLDDQLDILFRCHNSKKPATEDTHGGMGLKNTRKRLDLIYGRQYTLDITSSDKDYLVELRLPHEAKP